MYQAVEEAKRLLQAQRMDEAQQLLEEIDRRNLSTADSLYLLATIYHRRDLLADAVTAFKRSLELDPNFVDSAISLSIIYNDTGHYQQGKEIFLKAQKSVEKKPSVTTPSIVLDKELSHKHYDLAQHYRKLQQFPEAVQNFKKAAELDPENLDAHIQLAKTHAQSGEMQRALAEMQKMVRQYPRNADMHIQLALLHFAIGNTVDAQIELTHAQSITPDHPQIKMYLSMAQGTTESTL